MNDFWSGAAAIIGGILTVALVAVVVSGQAQTPQIIQNTFSGLSSAIQAAVAPVSGGTGFGSAHA